MAPTAWAQDDESIQRVRTLIERLDAAEFSARELATQDLIDLGPVTIPLIQQTVISGNRELQTRGFYVLKELAINEDIEGPAPAREALEALQTKPSSFLKRRSKLVLEELNTLREAKTLAYFQERGAIKDDRPVVANNFISDPNQYGLALSESYRGQPEDLTRLKYLPGLVTLELTGDWVDDELMEIVAKIDQVRQVSIRKAKITNQAAAVLSQHANLEGLEVRYCNIDDKCLDALKRFQFLTKLMLVGTQISPQSALELEELLGVSVVDYRRGGFLGVSCVTDNLGCRVSRLVPKSAADQLGIRVSDRIQKINDTSIATSEGLIEAISEFKMGDEVEVTWIQGTETKSGKAKLGEYQDLQ